FGTTWQATSSPCSACASSCPWRIASSAASLRSVATSTFEPIPMPLVSHPASTRASTGGGPPRRAAGGEGVLPSARARPPSAADHEQKGQGQAQEEREAPLGLGG